MVYKIEEFALFDFCFARRHVRFLKIMYALIILTYLTVHLVISTSCDKNKTEIEKVKQLYQAAPLKAGLSGLCVLSGIIMRLTMHPLHMKCFPNTRVSCQEYFYLQFSKSKLGDPVCFNIATKL